MQTIPIKNVPAQSFSVTLDQNQWDIDIKLVNGSIAFSFTLNGDPVIIGTRAVAGQRLIPYSYLQNGNFALITANAEIPDYNQFGITQHLIYASQTEIDAIQSSFSSSRITADDFDSNGDLPLRFSPQDYEVAT